MARTKKLNTLERVLERLLETDALIHAVSKIENDNIVFVGDYYYPIQFIDKETLKCVEKYETEDGSISYRMGALTDSLTTEELIDKLEVRFLEADADGADKIEIPIEELYNEINSVKGRLLLDSRIFSMNLQRELYFIELFSHVLGGAMKDYCMQLYDNKIVLSEDDGTCVNGNEESMNIEDVVDMTWLVGGQYICHSTDNLVEALKENGLHEAVIEVSCCEDTVALFQIIGNDVDNYRVIRLTGGCEECISDDEVRMNVEMMVSAAFGDGEF